MFYKSWGLSLLMLLAALPAYAGEVALEIDPATYAFSGYSAHVRYAVSEEWTIGLGAYAMAFPNIMAGLAIRPNPATTTLKIMSGYGLFVDHYWERNQGWFLGMQLASQHLQLTDTRSPGVQTAYDAILVMPRLGYRWNLGNSGFYILPWMGVGYVAGSGSTQTVGAESYTISPILPFATVHVGYAF